MLVSPPVHCSLPLFSYFFLLLQLPETEQVKLQLDNEINTFKLYLQSLLYFLETLCNFCLIGLSLQLSHQWHKGVMALLQEQNNLCIVPVGNSIGICLSASLSSWGHF